MDNGAPSYATSRSRRSHRKSRLGCGNCKTRRVKCDETEPVCNNCLRHSIECDYGQPPSRSIGSVSNPKSDQRLKSQQKQTTDFAFISSSQSEFAVPKRARRETALKKTKPLPPSDTETAVAPRPFQFSVTDMALFHNCFSADDLKHHMPDELVRLGFSVHYVLRLLLAVSGFHMKRKPSRSNINLHQFSEPDVDFGAEAERHLRIAIQEVATTTPQLNQANSHSLYIASIYIFICSLARGPQRGEYLAFRDDGDMPSLQLFLGVRSILEAANRLGTSEGISQLHSSPSQDSPLETEAGSESTTISPSYGFNHHNFQEPYPYWQPLNDLQSLMNNTFEQSDPCYSTYQGVFKSLCSTYDAIMGVNAALGPDLWPQIFGWLYGLPDILVHDMQRKHPVALLLISFFSVLLNELDSVWFITGWPRHIVCGVSDNLDDYHRKFLTWPLHKLGLV
ncbi:Zn(II)2Cys6 transcription factor [Penicillium brevicompactum]|uniref:Zn(II)2Cys6 transcription factor n=1 Tax=Penicillium brevicompactum TaxID=5074 RepID=A0A9W9QK47_PENBR|nr:Zn(II)2Cys6 transcription factor [Penicillium brevicompactum]